MVVISPQFQSSLLFHENLRMLKMRLKFTVPRYSFRKLSDDFYHVNDLIIKILHNFFVLTATKNVCNYADENDQ